MDTHVKPGWQGRFYEDFELGDLYRHPLGRTLSETDNTWFTLLTMNTNQIHFNAPYAARTEFGRPLVDSMLTIAIAIAVGQSVSDVSQNVFANLQMDEVTLSQPVFAGDTLWSESVVLAKRESASRPHAGIVTIRTRTLNQDGAEVCSLRRTFFVYKREAAARIDAFPQAARPIDTPPPPDVTRPPGAGTRSR